MPLASNYDPSAKTPTTCSYETAGCTDSTAHNYNPEATEDDGSCVERVAGCNLPGSELADPGTTDLGTATTVVTGCVIKVAGCMSASSPNYNPNANVDSGTCATAISGCMLATSSNYDVNATLDDGCVPRYPGCIDPAAINYAKYYNTDDGSCVLRTPGCKNKNAINYDASANMHFGLMCTFASSNPPPPPATPGTTMREVYPVALAANGISPAECNDTSLTLSVVESFRSQATADAASLLSCTDVIGGGSGRRLATGAVDLTMKLEYSSTESRASGISSAAAISTLTVAGQALTVAEMLPAILPVETVQVAPGSVSAPLTPPPNPSTPPSPSPPPAPPSAPPSPLPLGAIIGGAAGGVVVIVGIAIGVYCVRKKRSSKPVAVA